MTSSDLGLALHCQYDLGNKTISNGLDLEVNGEIESALVENGKVESPNVVMSVTARGGTQVERAQVGDQLELHFDIIDPESPYEVFVRELIEEVYIGETSRTLWVRASQHRRDLSRRIRHENTNIYTMDRTSTFMFGNLVAKHPGEDMDSDQVFIFRIISTHRDPLDRQIMEAININKAL